MVSGVTYLLTYIEITLITNLIFVRTVTMEFSLTQKGNQVLLYQGFEYTKYRQNENGVVTWRCRDYFATKCRVFLKTHDKNIIGEVPIHCHDSNPHKAYAKMLKVKMKADMKAVGAIIIS